MTIISGKEGDIEIVQGENDPPIAWQFLANDIPDDQDPVGSDLFDLTGSVLFLTVSRGRTTLIELNTDDDAHLVIDLAESTLTWTPTLAETRLLPIGRICQYEVERRIAGSQSLVAWGWVVVSGGRSPDA